MERLGGAGQAEYACRLGNNPMDDTVMKGHGPFLGTLPQDKPQA